MRNVLVVRLDSTGDMLLAGPAIRAVAARARVIVLAGQRGQAAAELLPGVAEVLAWHCPWIDPEPGSVCRTEVLLVADAIREMNVEQAVILTSAHQDPLPTALMLRLAGVPRITAACDDYPGSLLDVRHRLPASGLHEVERMLSIAAAAGFPAPDDQRLRLHVPLPDPPAAMPGSPGCFVVVHPGASVPARAPSAGRCAQYVVALAAEGWPVVVTGTPSERALTSYVAGDSGLDLGGQTTLAQFASVLSQAGVVITGNTGPAHLAAAVRTPVVSLFAPTFPVERWRPWGVPHAVLGAQDAPCAGSRALDCPVAGHPCLTSVTAAQVTDAVRQLSVPREALRSPEGIPQAPLELPALPVLPGARPGEDSAAPVIPLIPAIRGLQEALA